MKKILMLSVFLFAGTLAAQTNPIFLNSSFNTAKASAPTFSPVAGTYSSTQTVTISTATVGAVLCYTTDGSTPTESGNLCSGGTTATYSTPITVSTTQTVKALGTLATYTDSAVGTALYTISSACAPFSDSFSGSGALNATYWTSMNVFPGTSGQPLVQNSGVAQGTHLFNASAALVTGCTPSSTPYVQETLTTISGGMPAVMLYMSTSGSGYFLLPTGSHVEVEKCTSGSCSYLNYTGNCGSAWAAGMVFKVTGSGSSTITLNTYQNGSLCGTSVTDSSSPYNSGYDGAVVTPGSSLTGSQISSFSAN